MDPVQQPRTYVNSVTLRPLSGADQISLVRLLNVPLRHRGRILRASLAAGVLGATLALSRTREYQSTAAFFPQGSSSLGNLAGLAAQFGVAVPPAGETTRSPAFYAELLRSHGLLGALVSRPFDVPDLGRRATFVDLYGVPRIPLPFAREQTPAQRRERAISQVADRLHVEVSEKTGVITVSLATLDARLSRDALAALLDAVSRFNQETRQTQAGAERRFAERRLAEARADLRAAEDRLQYFLQGNRELGFSPALQLQQSRLNDQITTQRQLVLTLTQSYERARLEEVRDTPVLTLLDAPELAPRPQSRRVAVWAALGLVLGALLGAAWAYVREYFTAVRRDDADGFAQFQSLRHDFARELRHPLRSLRGASPP